jgi:hypothetical protein
MIQLPLCCGSYLFFRKNGLPAEAYYRLRSFERQTFSKRPEKTLFSGI